MTERTINRCLWTFATLLTAAAVTALLTAFVVPIDVAEHEPMPIATTQPVHRAPDSLDGYEVLWSRSLRDLSGVPDATAAAAPGPDAPGLTLVGTIGNSLALLQTAEGVIQVRAVGESLAGAEVLTVEPLKVELRYNGKVVTLLKPRPSDG